MAIGNILENLGKTTATNLHRVIGNTYIVDYGIVKKVKGNGIVTVEFSVSETDDIIVTDCVLANFASSAFTLHIEPTVDDKVLVLFPRRYLGAMFSPKNNKTLKDKGASSYGLLGGIALLVNQYQEDYHKNVVNLTGGGANITLAYDKDSKKSYFSFSVGTDGSFSITKTTNDSSSDNGASIAVDANGNVSVTSNRGTLTFTGKDASIATDSSGKITLTGKNGSVEIS